MVGNSLTLKKCCAPYIQSFFSICFCVFFQQKFVLRGGSILNELPEVPDTNLLPFDENLDGGQQFDVEKIVVHPKFNPFTYEHDIALITLKNSIRPSKELFPVCLPEPKMNNEVTDYSGKDLFRYGRNTSHL